MKIYLCWFFYEVIGQLIKIYSIFPGDAKCQFRGLYAYYPDTEEVYKIYGTGPKQVTENMFETFFK